MTAPSPASPAPSSAVAPGREYHQALTGPGQRGWRALLSAALVAVLTIGAFVLAGILMALGMAVGGGADALGDGSGTPKLKFDDPYVFAGVCVGLAALVLVALLATRLGYGVRAGMVSSVVGRFRWGWAATLALVLVPVWGLYVVATGVLAPSGTSAATEAHRPEGWVALLVIAALLVPLQSAGEEYLFRGWLLQWFGVVIRHRWVSLAVSALVSATVFSLLHGSLDPWISLNLVAMALAMVAVTWRTGGLEAAVVLHAVNNVVGVGYAVLFGNLASSFVGSSSTGHPVMTLVAWVAYAAVTALVFWLPDRRGIERLTAPTDGRDRTTLPDEPVEATRSR